MRCYNGAWDSEAKALFASEDAVMAKIRTVEPEAHCTYFPVEQTYVVHVWGRGLAGHRSTRIGALQAAAEAVQHV